MASPHKSDDGTSTALVRASDALVSPTMSEEDKAFISIFDKMMKTREMFTSGHIILKDMTLFTEPDPTKVILQRLLPSDYPMLTFLVTVDRVGNAPGMGTKGDVWVPSEPLSSQITADHVLTLNQAITGDAGRSHIRAAMMEPIRLLCDSSWYEEDDATGYLSLPRLKLLIEEGKAHAKGLEAWARSDQLASAGDRVDVDSAAPPPADALLPVSDDDEDELAERPPTPDLEAPLW